MIPLGDDNPRRGTRVITLTLVAVNVAVFLFEVSLGDKLAAFIQLYGAVPSEILRMLSQGQLLAVLMALVTSMFLHGGWLHLGGNMLYLWIFGDNVEDRIGHVRYALFYFGAGVGSMLTHSLSDPASQVPAIGASGAIAAILGAYLVLFPRARVTVLVPLFLFFPILQVPAIIVLGFWFVSQLANGVLALTQTTVTPVAWWAHIGGFAIGALLGRPLSKRESARFNHWREW